MRDPTGIKQHGRDPAMAVTPVLAGHRDEVGCQRILVGPPARYFPSCRPVLPWNVASFSFRRVGPLLAAVDTMAAANWAQDFRCADLRLQTKLPAGSAAQASCRKPSSAGHTASATHRPCDTDTPPCRSVAPFEAGPSFGCHDAARLPGFDSIAYCDSLVHGNGRPIQFRDAGPIVKDRRRRSQFLFEYSSDQPRVAFRINFTQFV